MPTRLVPLALAAAMAAALLPAQPSAPAAPRVALALDPLPLDRGASGLGLALRRLGTTGRVLYVTAHPDDEDNALVVALSRGRGLRLTLFTLTRGEGGQNETGPELFQELSVLRTAETWQRARHDGMDQRFGHAADFGFSYSVEECLQRWGREETLGEVVAAVRRLRPDVIVTMPAREAAGGAAHAASAQLSAEAFRAAADAQRHPEQIAAGLRPWPAALLYEAGVGGSGSAETATVLVDTGTPDPLLGMSALEWGSLARAAHRSQGTRQVKAPLMDSRSTLRLVQSAVHEGSPRRDVFDGVDTTLPGLARRFGGPEDALRRAQEAAERARVTFDAARPDVVRGPLEDGLRALREAAATAGALPADARDLLLDRLREEEQDFGAALALAVGLSVEPVAESPYLVPGQSATVTTRVRVAAGGPAVEQVTLRAPAGWTVTDAPPASPGPAPGPGLTVVRQAVAVPADLRPTEPHWRVEPGSGRVAALEAADPTAAWPEWPLVAGVRLATAAGPLELEMPVFALRAAPQGGELREPLLVAPRLSVRVAPALVLFPRGAGAAREVRVHVWPYAEGAGEAEVALTAPAGWRVRPASARVRWARAGDDVAARFSVAPAPGAAPGAVDLQATVKGAGFVAAEEWTPLSRPPAVALPVARGAAARALVLSLAVPPGPRVGYVAGAGDVVPDALRALGLEPRLLSAEDLLEKDLGRFSTIVLGLRAYQARPDLQAANARLLHFAAQGGHVVVQLSRAEFNQAAPLLAGSGSPAKAQSPWAPYPARVDVGRVADETAALDPLLPRHPLLTSPHRLAAADFAGWVQERGSFLFEAADPRYQELLGARDAWPQNEGEKKGLLTTAAVGRGSWTYVGLNLFRQVYVGTPGAYRLLANLVARPRGRRDQR
jgi:LmbE family N-acetylglucosaminyl deacetylase